MTHREESTVRCQQVLCVGAVAPANWTYSRLQRLLNHEARFILKDLEGYAQPLALDYGLHSERDAIMRAANAAEFHRFHLIGYSAGGSVALAVALAHPERISSLTLIEPAWIGNHIWDAAEDTYLSTVDRVMQMPAHQRGAALLQAMGPPWTSPLTESLPSWLTGRSASFEPIWSSFRRARLDIEVIRAFPAPVYLPVGGRSHPRFVLAARWLASLFPRCSVDVYQDRTHLEVPPICDTERFARAFRTLWASTMPSP